MAPAASSFEPEHPDHNLTDPIDIYGALRALVMMDTPVKVTIDTDDVSARQIFIARITDVQLKNRSFFMSELDPSRGNDLLRAGKPFDVECESRGARVSFQADGRLRYNHELAAFRGEFPSQVEHIQRRGAYRVDVPPSHMIVVDVVDHRDASPDLVYPIISGQMVDLSESGFKCRFQGDISQDLRELNPIKSANVRFNRDHHMDCSLELKHLVMTDQGDTMAGFIFTNLSSNASRYIRKLITDFQWEERQQSQGE